MKNKMKTTKNNESLETPEIKWGGLINEFLWMCGGANRKVLRQCPTEYAKYAGIGGTILFTAIMAMLSGGYALYTVFDNQTLAIGFGILWGLLIFNLDRLIVNTMYSDGKVTISGREFLSGLPRIIMAIFLGIVISCPLELRIFEDEINVKIEDMKDRKLKQAISNLVAERDSVAKLITSERERNYFDDNNPIPQSTKQMLNRDGERLENLKREIDNFRVNKQNLNTQLSNLDSAATDYNKKRQNINQKIQELNNIINRKQNEYNFLRNEMIANNDELRSAITDFEGEKNSEIERLKTSLNDIISKIESAQVHHVGWDAEKIRREGSVKDKIELEFGGFQTRMKAFSELRDENTSTDITAWFIMLLFILVEVAPTFLKMMIASGPYDDLLRAEMHKTKVLADKRISDVNDEINTAVIISTEINKQRLNAEVEANKELMAKIASAQSELLETAIEEWRQIEFQKIKENPSEYICMGSNSKKN